MGTDQDVNGAASGADGLPPQGSDTPGDKTHGSRAEERIRQLASQNKEKDTKIAHLQGRLEGVERMMEQYRTAPAAEETVPKQTDKQPEHRQRFKSTFKDATDETADNMKTWVDGIVQERVENNVSSRLQAIEKESLEIRKQNLIDSLARLNPEFTEGSDLFKKVVAEVGMIVRDPWSVKDYGQQKRLFLVALRANASPPGNGSEEERKRLAAIGGGGNGVEGDNLPPAKVKLSYLRSLDAENRAKYLSRSEVQAALNSGDYVND